MYRGVVVRETLLYKIRPGGIRQGVTASDFTRGFGYGEAESIAACIIQLCQVFGYWAAFTSSQLGDFNKNRVEVERGLKKLVEEGWLANDDGLYRVTSDFIDKCHELAPAN